MNNERVQVTIVPHPEPNISLYVAALVEMARAERARKQSSDADTDPVEAETSGGAA